MNDPVEALEQRVARLTRELREARAALGRPRGRPKSKRTPRLYPKLPFPLPPDPDALPSHNYLKFGGRIPSPRTFLKPTGEEQFVPPRVALPTPHIPDVDPAAPSLSLKSFRKPVMNFSMRRYSKGYGFIANREDQDAWAAVNAARRTTKCWDLLDAWRTVLLSVYRMRLGLEPCQFYDRDTHPDFIRTQEAIARDRAYIKERGLMNEP